MHSSGYVTSGAFVVALEKAIFWQWRLLSACFPLVMSYDIKLKGPHSSPVPL
jgi:hypothetical protein